MDFSKAFAASEHSISAPVISCIPLVTPAATNAWASASTAPVDCRPNFSDAVPASLTSLPYLSMERAHWSALPWASARYRLFRSISSDRSFRSILALFSCFCHACTLFSAARLAVSASAWTAPHFSISAVSSACRCPVSPAESFSLSNSALYAETFSPASMAASA